MVDNTLLDREELGFEEWAVTPTEDHLTPDSVKREQKRQAFLGELQRDPQTVIISHNDADGLGAIAMVMEKENDPEAAFTSVSYHGPYDLADALQDVATFANFAALEAVYITDLGCDNDEVFDPLAEIPVDVFWIDHHQWEDEFVDEAGDVGVNLIVNEDECATSMVAELVHGLRDDLAELAEVTKDHDLWIKEDPRSDRLGVMSFALDDDDYIDSVRENGVDHPEWVEEEIDQQLELNEQLEDLAVKNHEMWDVGGYDVAFTYIRGGRSSTIGNRLVEEHDPLRDIAIVMRPTGCSIYSHSDRETFARCHEVASELGGGGHPTASGFAIPVDTFREMAGYWATPGDVVRDDIVVAIKEVVSSE